MEKCVVIYKSKTGFTEKYANWIGEELQCEVYPVENSNLVHLQDYNLVIFGGGVRAGKIDGVKFIDKFRNSFSGKKLILFATGATPTNEIEAIERVRSMNVPRNSGIPFFYFSSGFNYEKMKGLDKFFMSIARGMMRRMKDNEDAQNSMVADMKNSYDHSSREYIKPLVDYVKSI
ncbi:MAG: flavodoxin domain-containing protein [Anaerolineaceae bacterium]